MFIAGIYHWSTWHVMGVILAACIGAALIVFCFATWTDVYGRSEWPWESLIEARNKKRADNLTHKVRLKEIEFKHQEEMARIENEKYTEQNRILGGTVTYND